MKVPFYILGLLLRYGPKSGYSLKQIIEEEISDFAKIKLPIIYYHLEKLKAKNYVTSVAEKDGNRPEKEIYTITDSGKKYFNNLLKKQLDMENDFEFPLDGIFYFYDYIDTSLLLKSLTLKRDKLEVKLNELKKHQKQTTKIMKQNFNDKIIKNTNIIFDHHIVHLEAELSWLNKSIEELSD